MGGANNVSESRKRHIIVLGYLLVISVITIVSSSVAVDPMPPMLNECAILARFVSCPPALSPEPSSFDSLPEPELPLFIAAAPADVWLIPGMAGRFLSAMPAWWVLTVVS